MWYIFVKLKWFEGVRSLLVFIESVVIIIFLNFFCVENFFFIVVKDKILIKVILRDGKVVDG